MFSIAKHNRNNLFNKLDHASIAILPGETLRYRSNDVAYPFRQDSNFLYLTGFSEPNAVAIFITTKEAPIQHHFILFYLKTDQLYATWHGPQKDPGELAALLGADQIYATTQLEEILPSLLPNIATIYYPIFKPINLNPTYVKALEIVTRNNHKFHFSPNYQDLLTIIHELRATKSTLELAKIRHVTKVSAQAQNHVMRYVATTKDLTEKQVYAEFYKYCLQHECDDLAYPAIVATGKNACILHYHKNAAPLHSPDLLLIDAGAEYQGYAADITRVFPVKGKFTARQKEIYNLVLLAQKAAINIIRPGVFWTEIQQKIVDILVTGLIDLKILHGNKQDLIATLAYKPFYMHNSGHFLGLDVHDPSSYNLKGSSRTLHAGMVITVEPGLYFGDLIAESTPWHNIGIRIEDDILVTAHGNEILSKTAVKEIDEIENLMLN